jgi:LysR family transcriptional regulator, nitrogen assimilation regulatory protein
MADFKRLGYFVQIAELGSLTRTAERLRIAQPSLSRQMRLLEEELGVTLFTRGHRGMQLTEVGEALRDRIAGPLRQIGHALYEIRSLPTEVSGSVIIGLPPTFVPILAPRLTKRVGCEAPKISLHVVEAYSGHLLAWMKRGELDAAILYGPTPPGVNATRLLEDELVLVSAAGTEMPDSIGFGDIGELPLVLPSQIHGLRVAADNAAAKSRTRLNVRFQADSFQLMMELVLAHGFCTILPPSALYHQLSTGRLQITRLKDPTPTRQLFFALQSGAKSPRAVLEVERILREEIAALVEDNVFAGARDLAKDDY